MNEQQLAWLKTTPAHADETVIDCNPSAQTITFKMGDNNLHTRQVTEIWTRVMGYHRPVSSWNKGKQSEYADRKAFTESATKIT